MAWRDLGHPLAGGSEVAVDRLAIELTRRGHEVALVCGGPVTSHPYDVVDLGGTFAQYARAPFVGRRYRTWDLLVDVENGIPYWSPLWRRAPTVCLVHHVHSEQWRDRFPWPVAAAGRFLERRAMPRVYRNHVYIAASDSTRAALEALGVEPARVRAIRWGVDAPEGAAGVETVSPQFLVLARLVPHKRVDLVLRAWEAVRSQTGGRLIVAGDGPSRVALERGAGDGVEFVGPVTNGDKWRLLAESWLLVHGASHEGWGVVIMEAATVGTPALAFDVAGVRDSVVAGETGVLVGSEGELVSRWLELAADRVERRRLGKNAAARAVEFTWERAADEFLDVATDVVGSATAQSAP